MKKVAIIGAGISGLFIANLFEKNLDYQITIYEKNNSINLGEGYGIQLSVNSVKLLNKIKFNKLQSSEKFNPEKINFYSNNSLDKICELNISKFNSEDCKYTTLKRSTLINFLKENLNYKIKTGYNISKIDYQDHKIKLTFENNEINYFDYLIISDGVFSKSKSILNNQMKIKYNNSLAIRGVMTKVDSNIDNKNISLFLGSDFHQVIYPVSTNGDLNYIGIIRYNLTPEEQKNYALFNESSFVKKVLKKIPIKNNEFLNKLDQLKIFPIFVSEDFCKLKNSNTYLIGDAFFAYPPTFAQGASQSIESAYELFEDIQNNNERNFLKNRANKTKMINIRSKLNQFIFHLSNPLNIFFRNILLKRLVKNDKFLESYLGKIYR